MADRRLDGLMLLYNFAVVLSGAYFVRTWGITDRFLMLGLCFVVALGWTAYYKWAMIPRVKATLDR